MFNASWFNKWSSLFCGSWICMALRIKLSHSSCSQALPLLPLHG
jgi:hypothetical protein